MGVCYDLWWVWLERCRDGRYTVNALHCDMWVVCARLPNALLLVPLVRWGSVFFLVEVHTYMTGSTLWKVLFL